MSSAENIDGALAGLREMMGADGYLLDWEDLGEQQLQLTIRAGEDACSDCLAPEPVLKAIAASALTPIGYGVSGVRLPEESDTH